MTSSPATQEFTHNDGTAVSNVTLTTAASTTGNPGINLDILSQGSVAKHGVASLAVSAGLADANGNISQMVNVPVTIVATDPSEQIDDPVDVDLNFAFDVKSFAANNATANLGYSISYMYHGTTTPLASNDYALGGSGVTPAGSGPMDDKPGILHAQIGHTFTLSFSENLSGQTIAPYLGGLVNNVGWLVDANLDASISNAPIITPVTPTFATGGGVDYGYTISGPALPEATTVDLDWATGTTAASVIGTPIANPTTMTADRTYDLNATAAQLGTPPPGANDLLVVVDPSNIISPADPSKVASLTLPDIAVTSLNWHPDLESIWASDSVDAGGVDFDYTISGSDLPQAVPVYLYWANGSTLRDVLGSPITENDDGTPIMTETAQGSYQVHIAAARLGAPPPGTTNLLVVADPPSEQNPSGLIPESNEDNNVVALGASAPDILANSIHLTISGPTIDAEFMPAEGSSPPAPNQPAMGALTLSQAEAIAGVNHFNWIQNLQMPTYEHEYRYYGTPQQQLIDQPVLDPDNVVTSTGDIWLESDLAANVTNLRAIPVDPWPFYLDEPSEARMYQYPPGAQDPSALEFEDTPKQPDDFLASGDSWSFTTQLVGVTAGPVYSEVPLALTPFFTWKDTAVYDHLSSTGTIVSGGVIQESPGSTTGPPVVSGRVFDAQVIDQQPTNLSNVSGAGTYGSTAALTATLTSGGSPLPSKTISFTLNEGGTVTPVGTATTNASGVATLSGVSLAGFDPGTFIGAVGVSFAGDSTDQPSQASGDLTVSNPLALAPIPTQTVPQGGTVSLRASATDANAGATVSYALGSGAPAGATINPITGAFSWAVPASQAPGAYPVTIVAFEYSMAHVSTMTSFTIDVQQTTTLSAVAGSGTVGGTANLTASLDANASPLSGKSVAFTLNENGTV